MKQPKALYLLNFVSMWECFSYYGMRALLVLYMVHAFGYSDEKAFLLYAIYTTLVEFGGIFGGMIADKLLGLKRAIFIGGTIIALGHVIMALGSSELYCFLGLGVIVVGTSLFRPNCSALVGQCYSENDPRRDAGYTIYYTGINIGGFLAALSCGAVGEIYGWHLGFGLAAIGMAAGLLALFVGRSLVPTTESKKCTSGPIAYKKLGIYIALLALFYGCEEQLGSTFVLFGERHVERETLFGTIPAASLVMLNPLTILLAGPFIKRISLARRAKIASGFLLLATAFGLLALGCSERVPLLYLASSIVLISLGELFIGPTIFSAASELASNGNSGVTMGAVSLGFSAANLLSGFLSQMMTVTIAEESARIYMQGFIVIAVGTALVSAHILQGGRQKQRFKEQRLYD